MPDFVLVSPAGKPIGHFSSDGKRVQYNSITRDTDLLIQTGEDHIKALARKIGQYGEHKISDCTAHPTELPRGAYYPRMARPTIAKPKEGLLPDSDAHEHELASSRGQVVTLMRLLERICQTVHPCKDTFKTYGHDIRNLLILACTGVEAQWRAVLVANGMSGDFNTKDYVKLAIPSRLNEYAVSLPYYPWLDPIRPFEHWSATGAPTKDLSWYKAYNDVKHDRAGKFNEATLIHAFNAVVACVVLLIAQFGPLEAFRWRVEFGYFFYVSPVSTWTPAQFYIEPAQGSSWTAQPYPFP